MREMADPSFIQSEEDQYLDGINQKLHHRLQHHNVCSAPFSRQGQRDSSTSIANGVTGEEEEEEREEQDITVTANGVTAGEMLCNLSSTSLHHLAPSPSPSAMQQHVLFWDRDNDKIIYPQDVYTGFRDLGFSIPFALLSLLIPFFFSYPTRLGHSLIPDPLFRIYVDSIHKAKHGSDSGIYDNNGRLRPDRFDEMFARFDSTGRAESLGVADLFRLMAKNRVAADPAGWTFAFMEWSTTWLLLQRGGRIWKDDLRQCYDGSLFWRIRDDRLKGGPACRQGYGWADFFLAHQFDDILQMFVLTK